MADAGPTAFPQAGPGTRLVGPLPQINVVVYGLARQIVQTAQEALMSDPDKAKTNRVMKTLLRKRKLDIQGLQNVTAA
jgi:hypothetical protein